MKGDAMKTIDSMPVRVGTLLLTILGFAAGTGTGAEKVEAPVHLLSSDGAIRDWLILGAFPNPKDKLSTPEWGYYVDYLKSLGGEARAVITPGTKVTIKTADGQSRVVTVRRAQTAVSGVFHFDEIYGSTDYELAYAFCYIQSDKDQQVTAYFGSNDQGKVWVNGRLVHESKVARSCTARQDTFKFGLKKGLNPILVKVCEAWGDWAFVIEVFTDEYLALERQRPLARALGDIRRLDLGLAGIVGNVFDADRADFPAVRWQNPYEAEKLLGRFPLTVRWFDSQGKEVDRPEGEGHYTAVTEGRSPDGFLIRRAKRFTCGSPAPEPGGGNSAARADSVESMVEMVNAGTKDALSLSYVGPIKEPARPDPLPPGTHARLMDRSIRKGQTCLYWLGLPEGYGEAQRKWPMILSLHASRGQGRDLSRIGRPLPPPVEEIRKDFPFVVVRPQCPDEYDAWPSDLLAHLIDDVVQKYDVDARRVYVTGVSLGGRGSWSFACDYPERVAAVVPVCGTYDHPERIHRIKDVPVWAFHGDQDRLVSFADTQKMVEDLRAAGGNVRFTVYKGAGHGISGRVYRTKGLYDWLLQQRND
jgi:hypothetical protein